MKTTNPLYPITQPVVILLLAVIAFFLLISCSTTTELTEDQQMREDLHETTTTNRDIVGYEYGIIFKKRIYYTVTDSEGNPALRMLKRKNEPLRPIGGVFLLKDEYKLQH